MLQILADSLMLATRLDPIPSAAAREGATAGAAPSRRWSGWTRALFRR